LLLPDLSVTSARLKRGDVLRQPDVLRPQVVEIIAQGQRLIAPLAVRARGDQRGGDRPEHEDGTSAENRDECELFHRCPRGPAVGRDTKQYPRQPDHSPSHISTMSGFASSTARVGGQRFMERAQPRSF
jgi:hypothetical protein